MGKLHVMEFDANKKWLVLDLETTVKTISDRLDNSPKNPFNKCVGAYYGWLGWDTVDTVHKLIWYHDERKRSGRMGPPQSGQQSFGRHCSTHRP